MSGIFKFIIKYYNRSSKMSQPILDILINQFKKTNHLLPLESRLDTSIFGRILFISIDNRVNLFDRLNLLDTILEICPEFNISGEENRVLMKLIGTNHLITLKKFAKRTRFDYHLNKINYLNFSIVKKYLEKYDPCKSVNSLSHKPNIDVNNNELIFEISIGITRIITNETMILMEKLSKLHIDDLENIKKLMLSGVSTELNLFDKAIV